MIAKAIQSSSTFDISTERYRPKRKKTKLTRFHSAFHRRSNQLEPLLRLPEQLDNNRLIDISRYNIAFGYLDRASMKDGRLNKRSNRMENEKDERGSRESRVENQD